ncbi:MAG: metallophosphoesterase [Thaumarchaeota archaeon]|nr:metallophosphoesterase [Nitrososphaerota archaeon]
MARLFARPRISSKKGSGGIQVTFKQKPYTNQTFHPLPPPTGAPPFRVDLADVLPSSVMANIVKSGSLTIHVVGDTGGVSNPVPQQLVADALERDLGQTGPQVPSFFYVLGDVIYYYGEAANYYPQFYEPYSHYTAPIFAIPGNHDGDLTVPAPQGVTSLEAFVNNFCATTPHVTADAGPVDRDAMTQPNPYWTLLTPFSTMIGLYSNVPEGGVIMEDQSEWLASELGEAPTDRALVVSVHHPSFSADTAHGGSETMLNTLDAAFEEAGRYPDIVLSGHVHNYQRYTRQVAGRDIPYIVAGTGGYFNLYSLQTNPDGSQLEVPLQTATEGVTLENYWVQSHGYMEMTFQKGMVTGQFYAVAESSQPNPGQSTRIDTFSVDLTQNKLVRSTRRP